MNNKEFDLNLIKSGLIAGVDEVGRGSLAGPLVVCALVLPRNFYHPEINDSKQISKEKRELLYQIIMENKIIDIIEIIEPEQIDQINILNATKQAMARAIAKLPEDVNVLIDQVKINDKCISIVKGDELSFAIAAASIVAKVKRDHIMEEYNKQYPGYHFDRNVGYGTKAHLNALSQLGITPIHRKTFRPVKEIIDKDLPRLFVLTGENN